jgi:hypothetical protein
MTAAPKHWLRFTGIAALAVAAAGCGSGETKVRPFVKRGGDTPAEKTQEKTPDKTDGAPDKTDGKTN